MSYPYSQLTDGEHVLVHRHSHWKVLIMPLAAAAVIVAGCGWLAALMTGQPWHQPAWIALAVLAAGGAAWFAGLPVLRWKATHFVITTEKVMAREGLIARSGMTIPLSHVATVQTQYDLNDRLFGCGTLIVESHSERPIEFTDIPSVETVSTQLYQAAHGDPDLTLTP